MLIRPDALQVIHDQLLRHGEPKVCVWRIQTFTEKTGTLLPLHVQCISGAVREIPSREILGNFVQAPTWRYLPLSLNSCARRDFVEGLRAKFGVVYNLTSPDYTSAFMCLALAPVVLYIDRPLVVQRALNESNGAKALHGDRGQYLSSIGDFDTLRYVPIKAMLSCNVNFNDFLASKERIGPEFPDVPLDWPAYFRMCRNEIRWLARVQSRQATSELWREWARAAADYGIDADALRTEGATLSAVKQVLSPVRAVEQWAYALGDALRGRSYGTALEATRSTRALALYTGGAD
jgi:hypothetical protein